MERVKSRQTTPSGGDGRVKGDGPVKGDGESRADETVTRTLAKLMGTIEELDRRVTRNREDIDMQFQRLAELQAVIDRMQIAAGKARAKRDRRGE